MTEELQYKCTVLERALDVLDTIPDSTLRAVHRAIEGGAQAVWRRRLTLHASDLVRFGRTYRHWRNSLVPVIESDGKCQSQLLALANPHVANDLATDASVRQIAVATVVRTDPLVLDVGSRRIDGGSRIVLLHVNDDACVEHPAIDVTPQKGSFKFSGFSIGPLSYIGDDDAPRRLTWAPANIPSVSVGDRLIVADLTWFSTNTNNKFLNVDRPKADEVSAPKATCEANSYADDPDGHQYCCRPHEGGEADWSDQLAKRRARGELNPDVWPPVVDGDAFEVAPVGAPIGDATTEPATTPPADVTMDDLE